MRRLEVRRDLSLNQSGVSPITSVPGQHFLLSIRAPDVNTYEQCLERSLGVIKESFWSSVRIARAG